LCVDGNCKSIRLLSLGECRNVTTKGIKLALDNLPQLSVLNHAFLLKCLAEIAQNVVDHNLCLPKYSLKTLIILKDFDYWDPFGYKSGSLLQSVLLCPNVTRVYLNVPNSTWFDWDGTELLSLLSLEKLYTLEISYNSYFYSKPSFESGLTFNGVVPILKKFGLCLKKLILHGFYFIDIPAIINFCPNLELLSISVSSCVTDQSVIDKAERPIALQKLKELHIRAFPTISSENLLALLSSSSLLYILLECNALSDHVFHKAANLHSFPNLEYLYLYNNNLVTKKGIEIFLNESNPLRTIFLQSTSGITSEDVNDWNDKAIWIMKNWQFKLYFYSDSLKICLSGKRDTKERRMHNWLFDAA
jgi:hypothetical protein